jgi:hypothetical protein
VEPSEVGREGGEQVGTLDGEDVGWGFARRGWIARGGCGGRRCRLRCGMFSRVAHRLAAFVWDLRGRFSPSSFGVARDVYPTVRRCSQKRGFGSWGMWLIVSYSSSNSGGDFSQTMTWFLFSLARGY